MKKILFLAIALLVVPAYMVAMEPSEQTEPSAAHTHHGGGDSTPRRRAVAHASQEAHDALAVRVADLEAAAHAPRPTDPSKFTHAGLALGGALAVAARYGAIAAPASEAAQVAGTAISILAVTGAASYAATKDLRLPTATQVCTVTGAALISTLAVKAALDVGAPLAANLLERLHNLHR